MTILRFEIRPCHGEKGISEIIVGIGEPSEYCLQPKDGHKRFGRTRDFGVLAPQQN